MMRLVALLCQRGIPACPLFHTDTIHIVSIPCLMIAVSRPVPYSAVIFFLLQIILPVAWNLFPTFRFTGSDLGSAPVSCHLTNPAI
jgi:hypothetical protein